VEWPYWDDLHGFWSELPNYNPVGVSTSTAGQDFGAHAAALFVKPSNNQEDEDCVSNHGSGIPDLDGVDPGSEALSQDWNLELLERSFTAVQDGGDGGGSPANGGEDNSRELKVRLYFILANQGHNCNNRNWNYLSLSCPNTCFRLRHLNLIPLPYNVILSVKPLRRAQHLYGHPRTTQKANQTRRKLPL